MDKTKFAEEVAASLAKYAPEYNIKCYSAIIAQFGLESNWGSSNKVVKGSEWRHNYAGLKWRNGRLTVTNEYFSEWTAEQNSDGSYTNIESRFFKFKSLDECVLGYLQFINISAYSNLKGVTDYKKYLENIRADKYCTSLNYVQNCCKVVETYNLTKYDPKPTTTSSEAGMLYRAQVGAYANKANAIAMQKKLQERGFSSIIKQYDNLYKVQCGAYSSKGNCEAMVAQLIKAGFNAIMVKY